MPEPKRVSHGQVVELFKAFRKAGYVARMNFECCMSCGVYAIREKYTFGDEDHQKGKKHKKGYVFFHRQDTARAFPNDSYTMQETLYLAWDGNGHELARIIEHAGFVVEWNGSDGKKIGIQPQY